MANEINESERNLGVIQIGIILFTVCLSVLVTAILGPSLPKMEAEFVNVEFVAELVALNMTVPMLVMTFFCVIAGYITDRIGRKWLLVFSALAYGVIGMVPMLLDSLKMIVVSRVGLGFAESFVLVVGAAYIGDLFTGEQRERMFAMQATTASVAAFFANAIGGALGDIGWRAPYSLYGVGIVLAIAASIFLWEPEDRVTARNAKATKLNLGLNYTFQFNIKLIAANSFVTIFASLVFIVIPLNFSYLFDAIGVDQVAKIGMAYGVNSLGIIVGSVLFGWLLNSRTNIGGQLAFGFGLLAVGFLIMWIGKAFLILTIAGFIGGIGAGILLPALIVWSLNLWPPEKRGIGLGLYMSCQYFGNFLGSIAIVQIANMVGGRADAMMVLALALVLATIGAVIGIRKPEPT